MQSLTLKMLFAVRFVNEIIVPCRGMVLFALLVDITNNILSSISI